MQTIKMLKSSESCEDDKVFRGTFEQQHRIGDYLFNGKQYGKAIRSYSAALEKKPLDRECLVRRAKCYLWFGDPDAALRDAEQSLKKDPTFSRGLHVKAEALYHKGEFEQALIYFHRGYHLTAGWEQFRLGIQKAREAILNVVGSPRRVKLSREGDMSYFDQLVLKDKGLPRGISCMSDVAARDLPVRVANNPRVTKELLGELYNDRVYLEGLLGEPVLKDGPPEIQNLAVDGLKCLDGRTEFWRQQRRITHRPKHGRIRSKKISYQSIKQELESVESQLNTGKPGEVIQELQYKPPKIKKSKKISWQTIKQELESLESQLNTGKPGKVIRGCRKLEAQADKWDPHVPKEETMGKIYSYMGLAHQEHGDDDQAIECFETDLCLGRDHNIVENQFRALLNLGHLFTKNEEYSDAAAIWCDAIEICTSDVETMWIYHELGHCYQELGAVDDAYICGKHSLQLARRLADWNWQMKALVLLAKVSLQMERKREALRHFNRAIELSSLLKDTQAKQAITEAAHGLQEQVKMEKSSEHSMDAITESTQLDFGIDANLYAEKHSDGTASEHSSKGKNEGQERKEHSQEQKEHSQEQKERGHTHHHKHSEHGHRPTHGHEGQEHRTHHHGHHGHDPEHKHHEHHHASKEPRAHRYKGRSKHHHAHKDRHHHEHKDDHHGHHHVHHHHRHHHLKPDNDGSFPNFPSDMSAEPDGAELGESPDRACELAPNAETLSNTGTRISYDEPELFIPNSSLVDMYLPQHNLDSLDSSFHVPHSASSKEYDSTDDLAVP